tara:strand:- start:827 stop:1153 length:327 start_codon:yes stop_codon:yes gene_type:complete
MSDKKKESTAKRRSNGQFGKGNTIGKQFKPGNNANPNGRRGALADIINEVWDETNNDGVTNKELMVRKVLQMAKNGSLGAVNYLSDRAEGKSKEFVETKIIQDELIVG